jgi:hypothetical protein
VDSAPSGVCALLLPAVCSGVNCSPEAAKKTGLPGRAYRKAETEIRTHDFVLDLELFDELAQLMRLP